MKNLLKTTIIIFIIITLAPSIIYAAWLDNVPTSITQPDGTTVKIFSSGDEFHNWRHDINGFTIIQDALTGFWCWAKAENGNLVSTSYPIHLHSPESLNLRPNQNISEEVYRQKREKFDTMFNLRNRTRAVGEVNNIVVFFRFPGETEFEHPTSYWNDKFNATGENVNSLAQYFWDASYQQLSVFSPIYPTPDEEKIISYQVTQPRAYYQPFNLITNPIGYIGDVQRGYREQELLAEVISSVERQIPPTMVTDTIREGYVDNICFVVRGETDDWGDLFWPHMWVMELVEVYLHNKRVWTYNFNIEDDIIRSSTSVLMHEFGHSLGAPDYYRYYTAGYEPVAYWDLMAYNAEPAQSMTAHTKFKYMGWIPEIPIITESGEYSLYPITASDSNHAYKIASPYSETEYFIIEYRNTETGLIDSALSGTGLIIYRINTDVQWGNAEGPPDEMYVYRPNGTQTENGLSQQAFFSKEAGRTEISDNTNPSSFLSDGYPGGLNISDISFAHETISFNVTIIPVSESDKHITVEKTKLLGSYPNPFNPETTISFNVASITSIDVAIDIYNIKGQKVRTLVNDIYSYGTHQAIWNGTDDNGNSVSSGVYFYQMKSSENNTVKRMVLLK